MITIEEVKEALGGMLNNKTPGIDGLPKEFYVQYMDIIGKDLMEIINNIWLREELTSSMKTAIITLLYKKNDPEYIQNWRPISLLTTDYKIISKVLTNRLKGVMASIIHPSQSCGIKGRSMTDNLVTIRAMQECLKYKNSGVGTPRIRF